MSRSFVMILAAASSALELLQSLTQKSSAKSATGSAQNATFDPTRFFTANNSTSTSGSSGTSQSGSLSPDTMNALLAAQGRSSTA